MLSFNSASTVSNNSDLLGEIAQLENAENVYIEQHQPELIHTSSSTIHILNGFDINGYLECTKGRIIKSYFEANKHLGPKQQTDLSNLLIEKEFDCTGNYKITTERLKELAKQINELFSTENENIYFIPYNKLTKQLSTGKLYTAYNKLRAKIVKSTVQINNNNNIESQDDSVRASVEFLKHNVEPYDDVIQHWKASTDYRLKELKEQQDLNLSKYFSKFPSLKCSNLLADLFEIDFNHLYRESANKLIDDWPKLNEILIEIAKSKVKCNSLEQTLLICNELTGFFLLPFLINSNFGRKRTANGSFKLTKTEISDQFIIKATDITHMQNKIAEVKTKVQNLKETFQPLPVILGDNNPIGYIYIDEKLYLVGSPLKAIDLCFKIFHVTHSKYPIGAEALWVFVQQCIYGIKTSWDKNFISVNNLLSLVENRK